jgi:hypothetical protein
LFAVFQHRLNLLARDIRDEELHGIGADINDSAARGWHETIRTAGVPRPKLKGGDIFSTPHSHDTSTRGSVSPAAPVLVIARPVRFEDKHDAETKEDQLGSEPFVTQL